MIRCKRCLTGWLLFSLLFVTSLCRLVHLRHEIKPAIYSMTGSERVTAPFILIAGQSNAVALSEKELSQQLRHDTGREVKVFNCAVGSTYIAQHATTDSVDGVVSPLARCLNIIREQQARGRQLAGVLFWQGESDTFNPQSRKSAFRNHYATQWLSLFLKMQQQVRNEAKNPNLLFVVVKLPGWQSVGCIPNTVSVPSFKLVTFYQAVLPKWTTNTKILAVQTAYYDCGEVHFYKNPKMYSHFVLKAAFLLKDSL